MQKKKTIYARTVKDTKQNMHGKAVQSTKNENTDPDTSVLSSTKLDQTQIQFKEQADTMQRGHVLVGKQNLNQ